jgi:predicted Zn finger-like uncharacterized protein
MSMATRCTTCGTIFRVVQDQLKVSEGWVRCGRCDAVFNAIESLFDLERESPPPWQPDVAAKAAVERAARNELPFDERPTEQDLTELDEEDRIASRFFHPEQDDVERSPAQAVAQRDRTDFADAQFNSDLLGEVEGADAAAASSAAGHGVKPSFVQAADREARWHTRRARRALTLGSAMLVVIMALQAAHYFRDTLVAQWPQSGPWFAAWCGFAGCRIEAPRRIEDISVENSAISHVAPGTDSFRLSVTLRNHAALAVRMPSIDLSLTDTQGQLIARRALNPEDFGSTGKVMGPGADAPLQALISAGNARVVGYTVEVFYP